MSLTVREKAEGGKDLRTLWASVRVTTNTQSILGNSHRCLREKWINDIITAVKKKKSVLHEIVLHTVEITGVTQKHAD